MIYEFDEFRLDLVEKRLLRNGRVVALQPKVFDLLAFFVEKNGELASHDDLMSAVWSDTFVGDSNLGFCIHALRKALGKNMAGDNFIVTVPKRGYRFVADVRFVGADPNSNGIPATDDPITKPIHLSTKFGFTIHHWLIFAGITVLFCLSIFVVGWQQNGAALRDNALGTDVLAVLPFESAGASDGDFGTGLADAMITNLSKIRRLEVLPIGSVRKFAGQDLDARTVGKSLGVESVLTGSYRFEGENVRVTATLLRVSDGTSLWTETLTQKNRDRLELENFVSLRTARLLSLKLSQTEDERSLIGKDLNPEAVQNYLAGLKIWQSRELNRRPEMMRYFEKAIELAPDWSLAYSGLAECLLSNDNNDHLFTKWERIEQTTKKALDLDGSNAQALTSLAKIYYQKYWDWENADISFKKALAINRDSAYAHHEYGNFLGVQRRFVEARTEIEKAIAVEPFSPFYYVSLCEIAYFDHRYDDALAQCHSAENLEADAWYTRKQLFWVYVMKKDYSAMLEMVAGNLSAKGRSEHPLTKAIEQNDLRPFWQGLINERLDPPDITLAFPLATFYMQIGEKEKAMDALEQALDNRDEALQTIDADPVFDTIRNESRFVKILENVGLRPRDTKKTVLE